MHLKTLEGPYLTLFILKAYVPSFVLSYIFYTDRQQNSGDSYLHGFDIISDWNYHDNSRLRFSHVSTLQGSYLTSKAHIIQYHALTLLLKSVYSFEDTFNPHRHFCSSCQSFEFFALGRWEVLCLRSVLVWLLRLAQLKSYFLVGLVRLRTK